MLVLMVCGLCSSLSFPYVQFPCNQVSGDQLYNPFWEGLERCGFYVLALVCDGLAVFFRLHNPQASPEDVYKVPNPYSRDNCFIYFLSDVPHLLKTTRNAWYNKTRNLWVCAYILPYVHL